MMNQKIEDTLDYRLSKDLKAAAKTLTDTEARYALYKDAEQILIDDWGTCPLTVRMQIAAVKDGVKGVSLTPFRFRPFNTVTMD